MGRCTANTTAPVTSSIYTQSGFIRSDMFVITRLTAEHHMTPPAAPTAAAAIVEAVPATLAPACPDLLVDYLFEVFDEGDVKPVNGSR